MHPTDTLALTGAATIVAAAGVSAVFAASFGPGLVSHAELPLYGIDLVPVALGWLVTVRAPSSPAGPALAWTGGATLGTRLVELWGETAGTADPWWGSSVAAVIGPGFWPWQLMGFLWLMLVFPSGLLPGRRWRVVAWCGPVAAVLINIGLARAPGTPADAPPSTWQLASLLPGMALLLVTLLGAVISLSVRRRHGDERTRQQLRWVVFAGASVPVLMAASWWLVSVGVPGEVAYAGFILGMLVLVPAAVTVAILRHDLFDIDRLISSSTALAVTTVASAGIFAAAVVVFSELFGDRSRLGTTGAAFLTALLLLPVHHRVHRLTGRVFDRERTIMLARVQRFVDDVRSGLREPEDVEEMLRVAVGDADLRLALALPGHEGGYVDVRGEAVAVTQHAGHIPLRTGESDVGMLLLSSSSARLVRRAQAAASAARLPIEVARLRLELRGALEDVRAGQERLALSSAAERRRLERDLHDGAQQRIVAVGMRLRAVQRQLRPGHPASTELDDAIDALEGTIAELRRLAHGVRPSQLDDGLGSALRALVSGIAIPVDLKVDDIVLPEVVATTAYFVIAEALANALKHADTDRVGVGVTRVGSDLRVCVVDQGVGGAINGFGLTSMRDRVSSVGGRLIADSPVGGGTTITAVIPCG